MILGFGRPVLTKSAQRILYNKGQKWKRVVYMKWNLMEREDSSHAVLPEYGRRKLILYADTLREIAESFEEVPEIESKSKIQMYLYRTRQEQNILLADQLDETARVLSELANETYATSYYLERMRKKIIKGLKENGLVIKDLYVVEVKEHLEIGMTIRAVEDEMYHTDDILEFVSELCHHKLRQTQTNAAYVHEDPVTLVFEEEVNFFVVEGIARAKKEDETDSGDSYLLKEFGKGMYLAALSDGMGSGSIAARDSERMMDLLDKFMETGFHTEKAIALLNSMMFLQGVEERTLSLDSCEIDLYQGTCRFLKYGAAASFIKRGRKVWKIGMNSLPLGVFPKEKPEEFVCGVEDGDYLIMMTDGVVDAYENYQKGVSLQEFIGQLEYENPKQMANMLMNMAITNAEGKIQDDMTVVVLGIWCNT
jgi:stage II sporulation protein E